MTKFVVMLTQAVLLFYGTQLLPLTGRLDESRFLCYGLISLAGLFELHKGELRKLRVIDLIAFGILTFAFFSYSYSLYPKWTLLRSTGNLVMYVAIFWALWSSCHKLGDVYKLINALIFVWFVYYLINVIFLYFRPQDSFIVMTENDYVAQAYRRFSGVSSNPNGIGNFSAIILPLVFWNFQRKRNLLNLFLLIAVSFSLVYSFSRNAFVCGVIGVAVYLYLSVQRHGAFFFLCAVFLIVFAITYIDLFGMFLPTALVRAESVSILGGRLEGWQAALDLIKAHPWRGYGFGIEDFLFDYFGYDFQTHAGAYVHNSFLGLAVQLGWIVPSVFYSSLVLFLVRSFSKIMGLDNGLRLFAIALYSSLISGLVNSVFETWIYSAGGIFAFPFFTFLMILMWILDYKKKAVGIPAVRSEPNEPNLTNQKLALARTFQSSEM